MNKPTVDDLLLGSGPSFAPSVATEAALDALVLETRDAGSSTRSSHRRRALWLVPTVLLAAGALTAGAVVVDQNFRVNVPVAIHYTTDTGVEVDCTATIGGGSFFAPKPAEVVNYYKTHDFSGDGQRIYDYALVLAGDRPATPDVFPDSSIWAPGAEMPGYDDTSAFSQSMVDFLLLDVTIELGLDGGSGGADLTSDCTGKLH